MSEVGQTEPSSFVGGTAELASIADAGEAWRPSTVGPVIVAAGAPQKPAATAGSRHLSNGPGGDIGLRRAKSSN
jgi:hypothetical protein